MLELIWTTFKIIPLAAVGAFGFSWMIILSDLMRNQAWKESKIFMEMKRQYPIAASITLMLTYLIMIAIGVGLVKLFFAIIMSI